MGIIRKTLSLGTAGAIDLRSDKERVARNSRLTAKQVKKQTKAIKQQTKVIKAQNRQG